MWNLEKIDYLIFKTEIGTEVEQTRGHHRRQRRVRMHMDTDVY